MKLSLGCGIYKLDGYINVDIRKDADLVWDLNVYPYPFEDSSCSEILMDNSLEHLADVDRTMLELHRILAPGGKLIIRVPHYSRGFSLYQHKHGFGIYFPLYFDPEFEEGYTGVHFVHISTRLRWFSQYHLMKKMLSPAAYWICFYFGKIIDIFANLCPAFCERVWCYWVGGFYEIDFVFQKPGTYDARAETAGAIKKGNE